MKYRIKDPDVVAGFKHLGWTYEFDEDDVKRFGFFWHGDCRDKIYLSLCEELEVEPVKEYTYAHAPDTTLGTSCKSKKTVSGVQSLSNKRCKPKKVTLEVQNPQLELSLWDSSKDVDRDGIINPKYKIT